MRLLAATQRRIFYEFLPRALEIGRLLYATIHIACRVYLFIRRLQRTVVDSGSAVECGAVGAVVFADDLQLIDRHDG